jgi:short-subunit dehydrogenase
MVGAGLDGCGRRSDGGVRSLVRRLALDLASAGVVVVGIARREDRLQTLAGAMKRHSPKSCYRVFDLAGGTSFAALLDQLEGEHGRIDVLANIAGVGGIIRTGPATAKSLRSVMEINVHRSIRRHGDCPAECTVDQAPMARYVLTA